ncbi:MAG: hypothetical protein NPINA01_07970 [Nitrospinaceae bacterium]|nr:MAG: hypothetical protein NPINA01_07970 [Nitrospinaceae bacterium]
MTRDIVSVITDTSTTEIIGLLDKHLMIRVPIVKNGKLVGIVSRGDNPGCLLDPEFESNM